VRILLVVNSFASSVTARNKVLIHETLSHGNEVTIAETNRRGHATRFAQDAATRGLDVVVSLGGDGTLNEVVNGVAGTACALGTLPGGSTNVFARTIGYPNDPVAAAQVLVDALRRQAIRPVGLGQVNGRFFTFHTGIGFDAAVVGAVERRANLKRWLGHPLFVWAGMRTWAVGYDRRTPHFRVETTGETGEHHHVPDGFFTIVLNTNPYTFLGNRPLDLAPAATLERGLVAITFRKLSLGALVPPIVTALRGGGLPSGKSLDHRTDLREVVVSGERPFPYQVDGDHLGDTRALRFRHVPDAVRLVLP
jgi:diacylglycerol kinase family enzyme